MFLKKINLIVLVSFLLINFFFITAAVAANPTAGVVGSGLTKTKDAAGYKSTELVAFWIKFINSLIALVGIVFLILIIYGGFLWMTARGNDQQIEKAKKLLIAAIIGLMIVIAARLIVEFIILYIGESVG